MAQGGMLLLRNWMCNSQQIVNNCLVSHFFRIFFHFGFTFFSSSLSYLTVNSTHIFYLFFWFSPLSLLGGSEQMAAWCLAVCWSKLQYPDKAHHKSTMSDLSLPFISIYITFFFPTVFLEIHIPEYNESSSFFLFKHS